MIESDTFKEVINEEEKYKRMAMNILQSYASSEGLDPVRVLKLLPSDFPIAEQG
jgi:hypothetical protein